MSQPLISSEETAEHTNFERWAILLLLLLFLLSYYQQKKTKSNQQNQQKIQEKIGKRKIRCILLVYYDQY